MRACLKPRRANVPGVFIGRERVHPMSVIRNIPIARKFTLAFGLVCLFCVALGMFSYFTFQTIVGTSAEVSEDAFPSVVQLARIQLTIGLTRRSDLALLVCTTAECSAREGAQRQR